MFSPSKLEFCFTNFCCCFVNDQNILYHSFSLVGSLCNIYWPYSRSHHDYKLFSDALTFDMTYKTYKYNLILGLFCGINHHNNTVIFGSRFLFWEYACSFERIFEEFEVHGQASVDNYYGPRSDNEVGNCKKTTKHISHVM